MLSNNVCTSYLLLLPQTYPLKTMHIYYLIVSVGRESGHDISGSSNSRSLTRMQSRSQLTYVHVVRISFILACWMESSFSCWLLAGGSLRSLQCGLPNVATSLQGRMSADKTEVITSCNVIMELASSLDWYTQLVRSQILRVRRLHKAVTIRRWGH